MSVRCRRINSSYQNQGNKFKQLPVNLSTIKYINVPHFIDSCAEVTTHLVMFYHCTLHIHILHITYNGIQCCSQRVDTFTFEIRINRKKTHQYQKPPCYMVCAFILEEKNTTSEFHVSSLLSFSRNRRLAYS